MNTEINNKISLFIHKVTLNQNSLTNITLSLPIDENGVSVNEITKIIIL